MSFAFTSTGLAIQTFDEIYSDLVVDYKLIYGNDINTDADAPDGQRIAIEAKMYLDAQSYSLAQYNAMDPDLAGGEALNKIIKWAGISRRPATLSQVDLTIVTDRNLTLDSGYQVQDTIGQIWVTTDDRSLVTGSNSVTVVAAEFGAVEASAGTITEPVTVVIGVTSSINALDATVGAAEEADPALRVRRNRSLAAPATSTVGGMFSAAGNLTGVTDVIVYENDTDIDNAVTGLLKRSMWVVIEGGSVADIVKAIAQNKTGGAGLKGSVSGTYIETITLPSGLTRDYAHTMEFDRPLATTLYIRLNVTRKTATDPAPTDLIKSNLVARTFLIAENALASDLYRNVYEAGTNFIPTSLEVSADGVTWIDGRLLVGAQGKFTISTANITITDIT